MSHLLDRLVFSRESLGTFSGKRRSRHFPHYTSPNSCQGHRACIITRTGFTKEAAMQTPSGCVGIDVSKVRLDVAVRPSGERGV